MVYIFLYNNSIYIYIYSYSLSLLNIDQYAASTWIYIRLCRMYIKREDMKNAKGDIELIST